MPGTTDHSGDSSIPRLPGPPSFSRLELSRIDTTDSTFRVRSRYPDTLLESVRSRGVRAPLLVEPQGERYRLISGWGRLRAAPSGLPVPCFVLPRDLPVESLWDIFLRDNDTWNVVEIARIIRALEAVPGLEPDRIVTEKFPLLGIQPTPDLYRRHESLLRLGRRALDFIEEQGLPLRRALLLLRLPAAAVEHLIGISRELRLTLNELGETLELVEEIAARDASDPLEVLRSLRTGAGEQGKGRFLRSLRTRRYPELTRFQQRLEALERQIEFSIPVKIEWDRKLDRPGVRLRADLAEREAVERLERELRANRDVLGQFFEIL